MRNLCYATSIVLLSLFLAGCETFGKAGSPNLTGSGMDMFSPVKMRLHPLSRIVPAEKSAAPAGSVVEARLEFTDQFGDITKSPGTLYFEIFRYEMLIPNHHGDRLNLTNFELASPQSNKDHWDAITRTYLFKIPLAADTLKGEKRIILSATLTLPNGDRLKDDLPINLAPPPTAAP